MSWVFLVFAIVFEVSGTMSLRLASAGKTWWYIGVVLGYVAAFSSLSVTLSLGMPLGVAYGIWSAVGVVLTALLGRIIFKESLTWVMGLGIVLVMGGVLLVETGANIG